MEMEPNKQLKEELKRNFEEKFSDRFLEIARLADKGDDRGYGKGLARLQIDIREYISAKLDQAHL